MRAIGTTQALQSSRRAEVSGLQRPRAERPENRIGLGRQQPRGLVRLSGSADCWDGLSTRDEDHG